METNTIYLEFLERNKVLFKCWYPISKERLWKALSDTEELGQWFMKTEWDFQVGGKFKFEGGWDGWIEVLREFECIQCNSSNNAFTRFDLKSVKNGTELQLTDQIPEDLAAPQDDSIYNMQPGGKGTHWIGLLAGWEDFLLALTSHITNKEIEDHFDRLCAKYSAFLKKKYAATVSDANKQ